MSKAGQFDDAEKVIGEAKLDVHYEPGEHDLVDEDNGKAYLERYGKNTKGTGWYSFDAGGVHPHQYRQFESGRRGFAPHQFHVRSELQSSRVIS